MSFEETKSKDSSFSLAFNTFTYNGNPFKAMIKGNIDLLQRMKAESEVLLQGWLDRKVQSLLATAVDALGSQDQWDSGITDYLASYESVCFMFGGQGYNTLKELRGFLTGRPVMLNILEKFCRILELQFMSVEMKCDLQSWKFDHGYQVFGWVTGERDIPDWYLYSAVIAYPLTLLSQFMKYLEFLNDYGVSHETMRLHIDKLMGHSQGIISAVLCSSATSTQELCTRFVKFLRLSVFQGLRAHDSLTRSLGEATVLQNIDVQSPMLSISGLSEIDLTNAVKWFSGIEVVIKNDESMFVVAGNPLQLVRMRSQLPRSASSVFIKCGGAYHTKLYGSILDELVHDAYGVGLQLQGKELHIPVLYSTRHNVLSLQDSEKPMEKLLAVQMTDYFDFALLVGDSIKENSIILDFGPGAGASNITRSILLKRKRRFKVICLSCSLNEIEYKDGTFAGANYLCKQARVIPMKSK